MSLIKVSRSCIQKLLFLQLLCVSSLVFSQDIQFSQFYAVDLYQNPAFTGSHHGQRAMFHQRIQWPSINAKYLTSFAAYDKYYSKYSSGFGASMLYDQQANGIINSSELGLYYSYELHLTSQLALRTGLQVNAVSRSINYNDLRFPSEFNDSGYGGGQPSTNINDYNRQVTYADLSSGLLLYTTNLWVGAAFHHMNEPDQSFERGGAKQPMKFSTTAGYKIVISEKTSGLISSRHKDKEVSITPTVHYKSQNKADQVDGGVYGNYHDVILAFWYRGIPFKTYEGIQNNESIVAILGYKGFNWGISYSYDIVVSTLSRAKTSGAHELHLEYFFGKKRKISRPSKKTPCPKFYVH